MLSEAFNERKAVVVGGRAMEVTDRSGSIVGSRTKNKRVMVGWVSIHTKEEIRKEVGR